MLKLESPPVVLHNAIFPRPLFRVRFPIRMTILDLTEREQFVIIVAKGINPYDGMVAVSNILE